MLTLEQQLRRLYEDIIAKEKIEIHLKNVDRLIINQEEALKNARIELEKVISNSNTISISTSIFPLT